MNWFHEEQEGVTIERRDVLRVSLGALALISLGWPQQAVAAGKRLASQDGDEAWDAFVKKVVPMAEKLVEEKKPDEDAYLDRVVTLCAELKEYPEPEFRGKRKVSGARIYKKDSLAIVQFRLQKDAGFKWHDHRNYNGILFGLSGETRVRSYDIVGDTQVPPKGETFLIKETGDAVLTERKASHLSRTRDNIHDVRARKESRLLDIFTYFGKGARSAYLNVEEKPKDAEEKTYEASWR